MKRLMAAMLIAVLLPACAAAQIVMEEIMQEENRLVLFKTQADALDGAPGKAATDPVQMMLGMQIAVRFEQDAAQKALARAGAPIWQTGSLYQDGRIASMGRCWQGKQPDGLDGSSAAGLTVNLETGAEIYLDELLTDYEGAIAAMEAIIERDILGDMSGYLEHADLLPLPQNSYSLNENGLTIYYPQERYRYFSGEAGSVTFYWHELADYIGEGSPVYALAHPDVPYNTTEIERLCMAGTLSDMNAARIRSPLEHVALQYELGDPDYTTDALVYPLTRERGYSLEIPKYAESDDMSTPVSAIRARSISFAGMLTTGKTTEEQAIALLGQPEQTRVYSEEEAIDALLEPGESLYFSIATAVLQLHFDETGTLSCVILRGAMPESLY